MNSLLKEDEIWQPIIMIDKDRMERNGCIGAGFETILCQFHIIKELEKRIRSAIQNTDNRSIALKLIVKIQREMSSVEWDKACKDLCKFCETIGVINFWNYFEKNWLCDDWVDMWCDKGM